jgi:uncharacterized repeat protein (TIGR01451 family)
VVYKLVVSNAGPSAATNVVVTDPVPTALTYVSGKVEGGAGCSLAAGRVSCPVGTLAKGATATVSLSFDIDHDFTGSLDNTGTVDSDVPDPKPDDNTSITHDNVDPPTTDLGVTVEPDAAKVGAGAAVAYTVEVTNHGPKSAIGAKVELTLPSGLASPVVTPGTGPGGSPLPACVQSTVYPNTYTCDIGDLPKDAKVTYRVTGTGPVGIVKRDLVLEAEVSHDGEDDNPANDEDSATVEVGPMTADVSLVKTVAGSGPLVGGQQVVYNLVASNAGPFAATGVVVTDTVPAGLTYVSGQVVGGGSCSLAGGVVSCAVGALANGASARGSAGSAPVVGIRSPPELDTWTMASAESFDGSLSASSWVTCATNSKSAAVTLAGALPVIRYVTLPPTGRSPISQV